MKKYSTYKLAFQKLLINIKKYLTYENNDIVLSFILGLTIFLTYSILNFSYAYSMNVKTDLKDNLIRFHILANSDSTEDQALKVFVKDKILEKYKTELLENNTRDEAIAFFNDNMQEIEAYAEEVIASQGFDYPVKCELDYADFPTKSYNDITLPQGQYLAFRVLIGDHAGKNFWCVLYPPLCYVEATDKQNFDNAKLKLEESLTNDEFSLISESNSPTISVKFKIVEMWKNGK